MILFFCLSLYETYSELEIFLSIVWRFISLFFFKMLLFWLDGDCRLVRFLQTVEDIINKIAQTQRYHHGDTERTMSCNQIEAGSVQHIIFLFLVVFFVIRRNCSSNINIALVAIKRFNLT